ncbi:hypothetical protein [Spongiivirga citrea]|uniref:Lipocalin-like domain-containing protein n=1 Tax=Spongiivirga citrea TaxID=1481457 RepID=A0A6M0CND7_9FLAO|nr:hypothetical protein [Spongiivirga citrea]NER16967.1 hypothetical protein [Spongiivirga citrea]
MTIKFPLALPTLILAFFLLQSCSKDEPVEIENLMTIENFIPEGKINGIDFNPDSGFAIVNGNNQLIIVLSETEFSCDNLSLQNENHVTIKTKNETGNVDETELVLWENLASGAIMQNTTITIDSIDDTHVQGTLSHEIDTDNFIEGKFQVMICQN